MFGWLKKKAKLDPKSARIAPEDRRLYPECLWTVENDDKSIRVADPGGIIRELSKCDLSGVIIETNDTGPWGADVWWLLFGADDKVALAFPQGASGEESLVDYISALPGFDHDALINAMASCHNNVFPVWRVKS